MAQNIFNLYSSVAFADHSLATWPLDDDFSFISLVSGSPVWTIANGASVTVASPPKEKPQETVGIADIALDVDSFTGSNSTMTLKTQSFLKSSLDTDKSTISINTYIYTYSANISKLEIGFEYNDNTYDLNTYTSLTQNDWTRVSHTASVSTSSEITTVYPYIKIYFDDSNRTVSLFNFSVGQWSEDTSHVSTGAVPYSLTSSSSSATFTQAWGSAISASPSAFKLSEIDSYGFIDDYNGYYLIHNNKMLAQNTNLPMVYGSGNITNIISPSSSSVVVPSLIFPGKNFLHENGKYKNLTVEFWMRISPTKTTSTRIFGPTTSSDGIYIENEFISVKVGSYYKSYFVGKWYRPMLIHFLYNQTSIQLMINGAVVIDQKISIDDIDFPDSETFDSDWLGFYSNQTIKKFQIDSFSIYPYLVNQNIAKRKLVHGQGVDNIEDIVNKYGGVSTKIDFTFSNYTKNFTYPDLVPWTSAYYSNLDPKEKSLALPEYSLPEIISYGEDLSGFNRNRTTRTWSGVKNYGSWSNWIFTIWRNLALGREMSVLYDNYTLQQSLTSNYYIKLKPNSAYDNVYTSIVFKDANPLNDNLASILAVFSINKIEFEDAVSTMGQTEIVLMEFSNASNNVFSIKMSDVNLNNRTFKIKYFYNSIQLNSSYEQTLTISENENEELYFIAGLDLNKINVYAGNRIKSFFKNMNNIQLSIGGNSSNQFTGKLYKLIFNNQFFTLKDMDDYFNSSGFAKVSNSDQINISDSIFSYIGNYTLLFKKSNNGMIMDVAASGYWQDSFPFYQLGSYVNSGSYNLDLIQFNIDYPNSIINKESYDDDNLNCYVTIQKYQDVSSTPYSNYTTIKGLSASASKYVDFDAVTTDIDTTKFKVVNNTVIFPPKDLIDFQDAYLTIHMELKSTGINTNPVEIKNLSLSSLAYSDNEAFAINTQNGNKLYPFARRSVSYLTKQKNPFLIYKDSTPYLYLTADSGIQAVPYPPFDTNIQLYEARGISIPVNPGKKSGYKIHGFSLWMMYNDNYTFDEEKLLFTLNYGTVKTNFYAKPEVGSKRASIAAYKVNFSGENDDTNVVFHSNGIRQDIYLEPLTWTMITIQFIDPISLDALTGQLELYPGAVFNNICFYQQSIDLIVDDIFESHLGLSNIVVQDNIELSVDSELVTLYSDVTLSPFTGKAI